MSRNDQNQPLEWTIAKEIDNPKIRIPDNVNAQENRAALGFGHAIAGVSLATAAYSFLEVKYGFPTPRDRFVGLFAIGTLTLYVLGFLEAFYRRKAN